MTYEQKSKEIKKLQSMFIVYFLLYMKEKTINNWFKCLSTYNQLRIVSSMVVGFPNGCVINNSSKKEVVVSSKGIVYDTQ